MPDFSSLSWPKRQDFPYIQEQNAFFNNSDDSCREGKGDSFPSTSFRLVIYHLEKGEEIYRVAVDREEQLRLWYIHSSDHTPVEQVFSITEDGHLNLLEERYSWYGAGLEFGSGLDFHFQDDLVIVSGYHRILETLLLRVARTVPQKLFLGDEELQLTEMVPGGQRLRIYIEVE